MTAFLYHFFHPFEFSIIMKYIDFVVRTWKQYLADKDILKEIDSSAALSLPQSTLRESWLPSYRDLDAFLNSFGDYLCGSHYKGVATQGPAVVHTQSVRNHRARRRKRVTYNERVEIREFTTTSIYQSSIRQKCNSRFVQGDWYFAPSFYRHIDKSRHRTASYRPPPVVTMAERRSRLMDAKHDLNIFDTLFDDL